MPNYEFDAKRWCMSMSKIHHARSDFDTASTFRSVAEEIDTLRNAVAKLQAEAEILRGMGHEVEALREAARPVVDLVEAIRISYPTLKWGGYNWAVGTTKVTSAQMDALAALVGEEGK